MICNGAGLTFGSIREYDEVGPGEVTDFATGFAIGFATGFVVGFATGFAMGFATGLVLGFAMGFTTGLTMGLAMGFHTLSAGLRSCREGEGVVGTAGGQEMGEEGEMTGSAAAAAAAAARVRIGVEGLSSIGGDGGESGEPGVGVEGGDEECASGSGVEMDGKRGVGVTEMVTLVEARRACSSRSSEAIRRRA